jgi:peptide/nickel transport system substrate-binding protein
VDTLELVRDYWRDVGIDMQVRVQDRSLLTTRTQANEHDASVFYSDGGSSFDVIMQPFAYFPSGFWSLFAVPWRNWWTGAPNAEEPPAEVRRQMELYDQLRATPDQAEQDELMKEILDIAADQFYVIGINLQPMSYGIARNNFHNVPEVMPLAYTYPNPGPIHPEQFFFDSSR